MFDSSGEMVSGPWWSNRSIWSTLRGSDGPVGIAPLFGNSRVSQSISPSASLWRRSITIFGGEKIKEKSEIICWRLAGENGEIVSCQGAPHFFFFFASASWSIKTVVNIKWVPTIWLYANRERTMKMSEQIGVLCVLWSITNKFSLP